MASKYILLVAAMFSVIPVSAAETPKGWAIKQGSITETAKPPEPDIGSAIESDVDAQAGATALVDAGPEESAQIETAKPPELDIGSAIESDVDAQAEATADAGPEESPQIETAKPPELDIGSAIESDVDAQAEARTLVDDQPEEFTQIESDLDAQAEDRLLGDSVPRENAQNSDLEASDENPSISPQEAGPALVSSRPVIDLSPELRDSLERQFKQIRKLLETEDAFSESLGEVYLSYGTLLQQAGRLDESREMLVNALHITKVNNGVNSIEQRPALRALFEMNFARQNIEEMEDNLHRIVWLEKKVPELNDNYSFDMIVRVGGYFLEAYLQNPRTTEYNLLNLKKATRYYKLAVNKYGDRPLSTLVMPYGELAYSNFLKSKVELEVSSSVSAQRILDDLNRHSESKDYQRRRAQGRRGGALGGSFSASERYLQQYFRKAVEERDIEHAVQALLSLGDLNILFGRRVGAMIYYEKAWDASQDLPVSHPVVASFDMPQLLPALNFFNANTNINTSIQALGDDELIESIPLVFDIDIDGNVRRLQKAGIEGATGSSLSKAKRVARKMKFRPIIENGKLVKSVEHREDVKIKIRVRDNSASAKNS